MTLTRTYYAFADAAKTPQPIRDVIATAIELTRCRYPDANPDILMLHPSHLATLGTAITAGGRTWQVSYNQIIGPREVRVGPVD